MICTLKYSLGDQIEKNEMGREYRRNGERRGGYRVLFGKAEVLRQLGRPRRRWEDNIKIDFKYVEWGAWTGLTWLRIGTGGGHV